MAERISKNISFTRGHAEFMEKRIESGSYSSPSEVVRAGLRLLEVYERSIDGAAESVESLMVGMLMNNTKNESELWEQLSEDETQHIRKLIAEGVEQLEAGETIDGPAKMREVRERLMNIKAQEEEAA